MKRLYCTKTNLIEKPFLTIILLSFVCSCSSNHSVAPPDKSIGSSLDLVPTESPVDLEGPLANFYQDVSYGEDDKNVFDIFLPSTEKAAPLVIYIHGGGFTGGDKAKPYPKFQPMINNFLSNGIAFASVNYRLLNRSDNQGILKCLNDSKRALQFIRYHSKDFNIDKNSIILMGGSAGAGTSLWIGLQDDMAQPNAKDPVLQESTRVRGIIALLTQAHYDILEWHNDVFSEYQDEGMDLDYVLKVGGSEERVYGFYGFDKSTDLYSATAVQRRNELNMLKMMSSDDPELYVENTGLPYSIPTRSGELTHHALHAKALMDKAKGTGIEGNFHIPKMGIDTRNGEDMEEFVLRILGN